MYVDNSNSESEGGETSVEPALKIFNNGWSDTDETPGKSISDVNGPVVAYHNGSTVL